MALPSPGDPTPSVHSLDSLITPGTPSLLESPGCLARVPHLHPDTCKAPLHLSFLLGPVLRKQCPPNSVSKEALSLREVVPARLDCVATPIWLCHLCLLALGSKLTAGHTVEVPGLPLLGIAARIPAGLGARICLLPFFLPSPTCLSSNQLQACLPGPRVELLKAPCQCL